MKNENPSHVDQLVFELQLRNYSPRTIHTYALLLQRVEKELQVGIDKVTTEMLKKYLHKRITVDGISTSTVNQVIGMYKVVQVDLFKRDWQTISIKRPRRVKKLPVILSLKEMEAVIQVTKNIKHKAIIMLGYSSGIRRDELMKIKPLAIDSSRMQVHVVQGKGKKDRYTILSEKALLVLRQYYKDQRPSVYLFEPITRKGRTLSESTLNNIVKNGAKKAGIKKQVSFHTLRHCFATHLLESGVNLRQIQQYLGHTSLKTTSLYLHLANVAPGNVKSPLDDMDV